MTSVNPTDNPMFAAPPHNTYPVMPGGMAQVPLYPRSQAQVQLIPVNPPGLMPSMIGQPAQKALKEGKTLGVSEISLCRPVVTQLELEESGEAWKYRSSRPSLQDWS